MTVVDFDIISLTETVLKVTLQGWTKHEGIPWSIWGNVAKHETVKNNIIDVT